MIMIIHLQASSQCIVVEFIVVFSLFTRSPSLFNALASNACEEAPLYTCASICYHLLLLARTLVHQKHTLFRDECGRFRLYGRVASARMINWIVVEDEFGHHTVTSIHWWHFVLSAIVYLWSLKFRVWFKEKNIYIRVLNQKWKLFWDLWVLKQYCYCGMFLLFSGISYFLFATIDVTSFTIIVNRNGIFIYRWPILVLHIGSRWLGWQIYSNSKLARSINIFLQIRLFVFHTLQWLHLFVSIGFFFFFCDFVNNETG